MVLGHNKRGVTEGMKITLANVNKYYGAILSVSSIPTDFKTAHALVMAKKEFLPQ